MQNKANFQGAQMNANCGSVQGLGEKYVDYAPAKTKPIVLGL
jgi:hypothetical protein